MPSQIRVCVPKILTHEQREAAVRAAIRENPLNHAVAFSPKQMAVEVGKRWANGRTLHVRFLNGDSVQHTKCEREVHRWEEFANVKFVFDGSPTAEIRVAFYDSSPQWNDEGSWSYIGPDALVAPSDSQTVNFGWLDATTDDAEWQRVVVHEFGHVLGCDHEDQQPAAAIKWNKPAVYNYFTGPPNNWTREMVDENVLNPTPSEGIEHTPFDEVSIMAYEIPAAFTLDGHGVPGGSVLSANDKAFIAHMYPRGVTPVNPGAYPALPIDGPFVTGELIPLHSTDVYAFEVVETGVYRIWTSALNANVSVCNPDNIAVPIAVGRQQLRLVSLPAHKFVVVVTSMTPVRYRIRTRRIL